MEVIYFLVIVYRRAIKSALLQVVAVFGTVVNIISLLMLYRFDHSSIDVAEENEGVAIGLLFLQFFACLLIAGIHVFDVGRIMYAIRYRRKELRELSASPSTEMEPL